MQYAGEDEPEPFLESPFACFFLADGSMGLESLQVCKSFWVVLDIFFLFLTCFFLILFILLLLLLLLFIFFLVLDSSIQSFRGLWYSVNDGWMLLPQWLRSPFGVLLGSPEFLPFVCFFYITPLKTNMASWKITNSDRRYIDSFMVVFPASHVSFRGCICFFFFWGGGSLNTSPF